MNARSPFTLPSSTFPTALFPHRYKTLSRTRDPRCQNTIAAPISTSEMIAGTLNTRLRMSPPFVSQPQCWRHDAHGHDEPHRRHDQVCAVVLVVGEAEKLAREDAAKVLG